MAWDLRRINNLYASECTSRSDFAIVKSPEYTLGKVKGQYVPEPTLWDKGAGSDPTEPLSASELRRLEWMRRPLDRAPRATRGSPLAGVFRNSTRSSPLAKSKSSVDFWSTTTGLTPSRSQAGSFTNALVKAATTMPAGWGTGGPDSRKWCPADRHPRDPTLAGSSNLIASNGVMRHYTRLFEEVEAVAERIRKAPEKTREFLDEPGCEELLQQMKDFEACAAMRRRQKLHLAKQQRWYKGHQAGLLGCQSPIRR